MQELMQIPSIGKEAAKDLLNLGIRRLSNLHGANPEQHDPEKLTWWNWKNV